MLNCSHKKKDDKEVWQRRVSRAVLSPFLTRLCKQAAGLILRKAIQFEPQDPEGEVDNGGRFDTTWMAWDMDGMLVGFLLVVCYLVMRPRLWITLLTLRQLFVEGRQVIDRISSLKRLQSWVEKETRRQLARLRRSI